MSKKKAVAYVRVSQESENVENQIHAIKQWAEKNNYEIVFFKEIGVSGTVEANKREAFRAMLKFCEDNKIDTIVFYDISRMSRNILDGLKILKELTDKGYNYYFVAQEFLDYIPDPLLRKKIILDFLWFAELYVEDIRKRTKQALERIKAQGLRLGRPKIKLDKKFIAQLYKKGFRATHIAKILQGQGINVSVYTIRRRIKEWNLKRKRRVKIGAKP